MRCCVPNCRNDSRNISKTDGITYHVFPTDPVQRQAWLKGLGRLNWEPKERATVCSQHFFAEDLYETQGGMRKVRAGAVPLVVPPVVPQGVPSAAASEPVSEKVCRMCLAMDVELLSMKKCKLEAYYELITGVSLSDARLPTRICALCARRAAAGARLRDQCVRADAILTALLTSEQRLTEQNIKSIDRDANNLTSPLTVHIVPDHEYLLITETAEDLKIKENKTFEPPSLHEVNVAEAIEVKNEDDDNTFFDDEPNFDDNMEPEKINDTDQIESNYEENDNFIPSDNSSCDSIPINQLKKAKLKKKKEDKKPAKKVAKVRKKAVKKDPTEPKIDRRRKPFLNEDLNETLFTIIDLTYEEQIAEIEKRQESSNYKNAVYKCTECYKGFLDEDAYETHMVRHTDACGEYTCKICKTHFKQPHALRKHITAHHTHRFSCNCCVYVTTHRQTARLHERWHKGTKYQCPHCPEEFVRFTTYMGHVRIKHPSDFVCARCGYSFVSAKGIELHKKLKHRLEDQPIPADGPLCSLCNIRFATEDARQRHMQVSLRHAADKEPKEANAPKGQRKPRDGKSQRKERDARREEPDKKYPSQMRKAEGPIPCEQCGMQLEDSRAYHGHFRRAHPDKNRTNYPSMKSPCMCEVCGRMFQSFALLKDHTWTHTGEKPFKCELCNKTFRMKQRLVAHRRVHSAQRASYTCAVCHKHFSTHSNRQRHMFIHTGLKPFKCEMCGKCFKHASEKRAHVSYVHLKKPWPKRARAKRQHAAPNELEDEMRDAPAEAPLWPPCDPKLNDMAQIIHDKPMYYNNIKI